MTIHPVGNFPRSSRPTTPEPGRRTPLGDRWVDIHVDRGHVSTQVDTMLACGYGRGVFQSGLPRPVQERGRYQMHLDANGDVMRSTFNTLRTGVAALPSSFINLTDYEEYVRQIDFLLWDGADETRITSGIEGGLRDFEQRLQHLDEIDALCKNMFAPPYLFAIEARKAMLLERAGTSVTLDLPRPAATLVDGLPIVDSINIYLGMRAAKNPSVTIDPGGRVICSFTVPHLMDAPEPVFAATLERLSRVQRASRIARQLGQASSLDINASPCNPNNLDIFGENLCRLGKAYVWAGRGARVRVELKANVRWGGTTDFRNLPCDIVAKYLELLGAKAVAFDLNDLQGICTFTMPPA